MVSERPSCPIILGDLHTWRFAQHAGFSFGRQLAMSFYAALEAFRNWEGFRLEPAKVAGSAHIFGIGEFISALALLVIIVTVSDFRYRYRFAGAEAKCSNAGDLGRSNNRGALALD
jgi:hypothetical protein